MSAAVVEPATGELTVLMTEAEAQEVTLKIKQYAGMVCVLVKDAHDKQAWKALGYPTWTAYCKAEFNVGKSRSYQLVKYAEVIALGTDTTGLPESTIVDSLPEGKARNVDRAELAELLEQAYSELPADAPINTRRELFDAVLAQLTADEPVDDGAKNDESSSSSGPEQPPTVPAQTPGKAGTDTPSGAAATGDTGDDAAPSPGDEVDGGDSTATVPPVTLPDDWRLLIGRAAYLLRLDAGLLRAAIDDDDRIDLTELRDHLNDVLEQNT